jgi:hypothetical protein
MKITLAQNDIKLNKTISLAEREIQRMRDRVKRNRRSREHASKSQKKVRNTLCVSLSLSLYQPIQPSKKDIRLPLLPNPELLRIDPEVLAPQWWKPEGWMGKR